MLVHVGSNPYLTHTHLLSKILVNDRSVIFFFPYRSDTQVNTASTRRTRRKAARPAELLAAATHLFVAKGYAATRVEEVAALANVSKGTLFLYYPSKEALLKAVVRENIAGALPNGRPSWKALPAARPIWCAMPLLSGWSALPTAKQVASTS